MTYDVDDNSTEDSQPRDGFEFICSNGETYRLTSSVNNLTINGNFYTASTISRSEIAVSSVTKEAELTVSIDVRHPMAQRYLTIGVPQRRIEVNVWRKQLTSGEVERVWRGYVTSGNPDGYIMNFRIPARSAEAYKRRLPTISVGRDCSHVLYETGCFIGRGGNEVTRTVAFIDQGRVVYLDSALATINWAVFGELYLPGGERMTIYEQPLMNAVVMQLPIYELKVGDSVRIYRGCDHTIATCRDTYGNQQNFGGFPHLPDKNPHIPNGFGIYESE